MKYQLIQDHGGSIDFQSPHGGGTTVTLALPIQQQEAV